MVVNGSFELQSINPWEPQGWNINFNTTIAAAGFDDDFQRLFETFNWSPFNEPLWILNTFSGGFEYERFNWFYGYIPEFFDGSFNNETNDSFEWWTFNDTLTIDNSTTPEPFNWFSFDDIFIINETAMFDSGLNNVESFSNDWS